MNSKFCLRMIRHLREEEEVCLYGQMLSVKEEELEEIVQYLAKEYERERIEYPFKAPTFDPEAALWGARTIYTSAQLLLYRAHQGKDLQKLIPSYTGLIDAGAILSADICLRFLPDLVHELEGIDMEDELLPILMQILRVWHYSAVGRTIKTEEELDFIPIVSNDCLLQLYCNRVIEYKNLNLAKHPALQGRIAASLGDFKQQFWNTFSSTLKPNV